MMEEHENEERELTSGMERSLAASIAAAAALIESFQRRRARRDRDAARNLTAGQGSDSTTDTSETVKEQVDIQASARAALAAGREDSEFWRTAPMELLHEKIIAEHGIDPRRVGEFGTDQQWITQAPGPEILAVYADADRWAQQSDAAKAVRDNIAAELSNYGLNVDELAQQPRGAAAEQIHAARTEYWAQRGYDPQGTAAEQADTDRDGEHVEQLLTDAAAAEQRSGDFAGRSTELEGLGDRLSADTARPNATAAVGLDKTASRSEQISAHRGNTDAGRAAAVAAIDHPTHPRDAVTAKSKAPRRPAPRTAASRDRSHGR